MFTKIILSAFISFLIWGMGHSDKRPNIIFFLVDDINAGFLGCAGHPVIKTPHVDALAAEGTRFSQMLVTTSICAASRASIFTSLHERTHKYTFKTPALSKEFTTNSYSRLLRNSGYKTGYVGKFGVGMEKGEKDKMFSEIKEINRNPFFKKQPDGSLRHETELCGDWAEGFLERSKNETFCLAVSFNAAHAEDSDKVNHFPWPKAVDGMYDDVDIAYPDLHREEVFKSQPEFLQKSLNRERYFWRWDTKEKYQHNMKAYLRMISGIDGVVGRVMSKLKSLNLDDNTIVIFTGDNGYYAAKRGFAGKWSHYEESLKVPLVIYDPRNKTKGQVSDEICLNIDLPATMLNYAGVEIPSQYQGKSLVKVIQGNASGWRKDSFHEHLMNHDPIPKWEGVRNERYVYANYFQQNPPFEFLHDLEKDPQQLKNLAKNPEYATLLEKMRSRSLTLRKSYGKEYSLENFPNVGKRKPKKK